VSEPGAPRIVLVHGAATTSRVWRFVRSAIADREDLAGAEILVPDRASSGDLEAELAELREVCSGAVVVGVSGGATLGLALAAAGVPMRAAILHEPAAGSLAPGLLDAVAAAWREGGVAAFGATLYGPAWSPAEAPADPDAVGRDLAMFRRFEPAPLPAGHPPVLLTVGALSPPARHSSVAALSGALGVPVRTVAGAAHAVHLEAPAVLASLLAEVIWSGVRPGAPS
jgi:pimeloyl-ACP methyl ester carboxylesterase